MEYKNINIGELIKKRVQYLGINPDRICSFMKINEKEIEDIYNDKNIDTEILLKWSKLLEYDFFRLYSQHLILYAPQTHVKKNTLKKGLPQFRKNIYTKELIDFILDLIKSKKKTRSEVIDEYHIPKTTLYKWITKDGELNNDI
ncbi:transposase [Chryseobacterium viscerum]|uniref:Transposase n=1 Tax=Chryseobacterium viscerum TaxID=1037377 RepID=A0A316WR37_9FLAO|nr:transposase [Chryseobacterium viscerum]PWN61688.1 transposase [Chryseobacterium viscerum]